MIPKSNEPAKILNPKQRQAVETVEGPVMVVAGPGTGKTHVLAQRVAHILQVTDTSPSSVLCLSFTESAANTLRERIVSLLGPAGYQVQTHTFHSFCSGVIQSYPEYFPLARGSKPLSPVEQVLLFEDLFTTLPLEILKPLNDPLHYVRAGSRAISELKREGVSVARLRELVEEAQVTAAEIKGAAARATAERKVAKQTELILLFDAYQTALQDRRRFDFEDMVGLVNQAFATHKDLLLEHQERCQYVLVDEYQDTNSAQNQLVFQLMSYWQEQANVCVVGDPEQSIFRFQGASKENMLGFLHRFPKATVIHLEQGYRCPQKIYNAAFGLLSQTYAAATKQPASGSAARSLEQLRSTKPLESIKTSKEGVRVWQLPSDTLEVVAVAEAIQALLQSGVAPEQIAVLYRTNIESLQLMETFDGFGIPYDVEGGGNVMDIEPIRQLLQLLQLILDVRAGEGEHRLFEVLCYEWSGVPNRTVFEASRAAHKARLGLVSYIEQQTGQVSAELLLLSQFLEQVKQWGTADMQLLLPQLLQNVFEESGFLSWINEADNKIELLLALQAVFGYAKDMARTVRGVKLADFLRSLIALEETGSALTVRDEVIVTAGVKLFTVHKAKGQEWEHVFVVGVRDGRWGNRRKRELLPLPDGVLQFETAPEGELAEERRSLYVAMTRAKVSVTLSFPLSYTQDTQTKPAMASQLLLEIRDHADVTWVEHLPSTTAETLITQELSPLNRVPLLATAEREYIASLLSEFRLSPTALDKYLKDPREFLFQTLLRTPMLKSPNLVYGSAMHAGLETLYRGILKTGKPSPLTQVLADFDVVLGHELLTEVEHRRWQQKGKAVLTEYTAALSAQSTWPAVFQLETSFGYRPRPAYLDDIPLSGKIDRLDWVDADKRHIRLTDYKTGKPRSVADIAGSSVTAKALLSVREQALPETIRGGYLRQLVFYQLLTQVSSGFPGKVVQSQFEFVDPCEKGKPAVIRHLTITDEAVADLKKLILEVMRELRSLSFLDHLEGW